MSGVFELTVIADFSAAHHLEGYPGDCRRVHGHNWIVEAQVLCRELDELGMALDFREVRAALAEVLAPLDHADLNALPPFVGQNPTAERLARHIHHGLKEKLASSRVTVSRVTVSETSKARASYREEE